MSDKPRPKHFDAIDKINKKIDDAFGPDSVKKDKEKWQKARDNDPKFQEWKKNRPHLKEKVERAIQEAREIIDQERS